MTLRVLIVEDDYSTQLLLRTILETSDLEWRLAESYEEAEFDALWADVAIVDHHLPTASGLAVIERIRQINRPCRIAMVTGDETARDRALLAGADSFLTKPFEVDQVMALVHPAFDSASAPCDSRRPLELVASGAGPAPEAELPWYATGA